MKTKDTFLLTPTASPVSPPSAAHLIVLLSPDRKAGEGPVQRRSLNLATPVVVIPICASLLRNASRLSNSSGRPYQSRQRGPPEEPGDKRVLEVEEVVEIKEEGVVIAPGGPVWRDEEEEGTGP